MGNTYSFIDVAASIVGPGGAFDIGHGSGNAEEGISVSMTGDKNVMTTGADGSVMHSLRADKSGMVTIKLLKTSPTNAKLQTMYNVQSLSSAMWGNNIISITQNVSGDKTMCTTCAFVRQPDNDYAANGDTVEWRFHAGQIDEIRGTY